MKRLSMLLLVLVVTGCATVSDHRYGYADDGRHGGYYYDREPVRSPVYFGMGWYNPYDVLFWGLRYSYFDPFWYPGFYYGVTYFPRYYHPYGYWGGGFARGYHPWRWHHPYSPYWGSYWDHYYAGYWHRPPSRQPVQRPGGRHGADAGDGVPRFGSARNAAERAAASSYGGRGGPPMAGSGRIMTREGWRSSPDGMGGARPVPQTARPASMPSPRSGRSVLPPSRSSGFPRSQPAPSRGMRGSPAGGSRSGGRGNSPPAVSWSRPAMPESSTVGAAWRSGDRRQVAPAQPVLIRDRAARMPAAQTGHSGVGRDIAREPAIRPAAPALSSESRGERSTQSSSSSRSVARERSRR